MSLITKINWTLHNYCKSECFYCPSQYRTGPEPKHISEYKFIANKLIVHYKELNRKINWNFSGGELLDMFDFPELLKLCKSNTNNVEITTNGGRIWLDWWAIEPNIDVLNLTYHYWQDFNLIRFIIQTFKKNNKIINVTVPLRPRDNFDEDWNKAIEIEKEFQISVYKQPLSNPKSFGYLHLDYTIEQFEILFGSEWVDENIRKHKSMGKMFEEKMISSPSFTNKLCNVGIENLNIDHNGWVAGSSCNSLRIGNIWEENFQLPTGPTKCKMISCTDPNDQTITKFE